MQQQMSCIKTVWLLFRLPPTNSFNTRWTKKTCTCLTTTKKCPLEELELDMNSDPYFYISFITCLHLCPDVNRGTDAPWPPVPEHSPGSEAKDVIACCFPSPFPSSKLKHYSTEAKECLNYYNCVSHLLTHDWCVTLQLPWNSKAQIPLLSLCPSFSTPFLLPHPL